MATPQIFAEQDSASRKNEMRRLQQAESSAIRFLIFR
jgi:hypothetical protein